jgi:hypothetical protein
MVDQCDNCIYYKLRSYGTVPNVKQVGECRLERPDIQGQKGWWPICEPTDWCGKYAPIGGGVNEQYIQGVLNTVDTNTHLLLPNTDPMFNVVIMKACSLINHSTKNDCMIHILDGDDPMKPIGFAGCGQFESKEVSFSPGLRSSPGNAIYVQAETAVAAPGLYVSGQGFAIRS